VTRADRRTLVRQLAEEGLSQRQIGARLGVSKDTVRRDLDAIGCQDTSGDAPPVEPDDPDAPQVSPGEVAQSAPPVEPLAQHAGRPADPVAGIGASQRRDMRRDLALLAQTGKTTEALIYQAVVAMAHAYRQARARGDIERGVPFFVREMTLAPLPHRAVPVEAG
jgi:hypothetical protein